MRKYYINKKTGTVISFNIELSEVLEFDEIRALEKENTLMEITVEKTDIKKLKDYVTGKDKNGEHCTSCGRLREKGKYFCKGLCATCYSREIYRKKHAEKVEQKKDDGPKKYECIDCGEEISSTLDPEKVKCPKNLQHKMVQKF